MEARSGQVTADGKMRMRAARSWLLLSVAVLLCVGLVVYAGPHLDWTTLAQLSPELIGILVGSSIVMSLAYAAGAVTLLAGMNARADFGSVLIAMLAGGTVGLVGDPKIGVPSRLLFYKLLAGIPYSIGTAQIAAETVLWLALMGCVLAIPSELARSYAPMLSALAALSVLAGIAVIAFGPVLLTWTPGVKLLYRKWPALNSFIAGTRAAVLGLRPRAIAIAIGWFLVTYAADALALYAVMRAWGALISPLLLAQVIVISYLVGLASMLPLGIGARDLTFLFLLQQLGAPPEIATAATLVQRTFRTLVPLAMGLPALLLLRRRVPSPPTDGGTEFRETV